MADSFCRLASGQKAKKQLRSDTAIAAAVQHAMASPLNVLKTDIEQDGVTNKSNRI
ncbi:MAG: hypothetical protein AB7H90_21655 [Alphaproteobacteria bacterium]